MEDSEPDGELIRIDWVVEKITVLKEEERTVEFVSVPDPRRYEEILIDGEKGYQDKRTGLKFRLSDLQPPSTGTPIFFTPPDLPSKSYFGALKEGPIVFPSQRKGGLITNRRTRRKDEAIIKRYIDSVRGKKILVVMLIVDIVESTLMSVSLPPEKHKDIVQLFFEFVKDIITNYRGFIWKYVGDGIIAIFPADDAFTGKCDNAIQTGIMIASVIEDILNPFLVDAGLPALRYRIGIDIGEVIVDNVSAEAPQILNDLFGYPLNLTSKIQSAADPNEILIGNQLFKLCHVSYQELFEAKRAPVGWQYPDPISIKNPYQLYRLREGIRFTE